MNTDEEDARRHDRRPPGPPRGEVVDIETPSLPTTVRGRRTRNALIQAAREVFEEQGFQEAKIADIPRRAGTSHGNFYTYFDSKEAIFREVVAASTGEMFHATRTSLGEVGSPVDRIREATDRYLTAYSRNVRIMRLIEQVAPRDSYCRDVLVDIRALFVQRIAAGIRRLQESGLADSELDAQIAASALGGMVENFARQWHLFGEMYDQDRALETLTRLWANGIGLDPAVARGQATASTRSTER